MINKVAAKFEEMGVEGYNKDQVKKDLTTLMTKIHPRDSPEFIHIKTQMIDMVKKTLDSVKYNLRPLNRLSDSFKGCFNLLAYDTMLDENDKLWIIEVNRGPDIMGLWANIGTDKCVDFFDDIFKLTVDPHYICKNNGLNYNLPNWEEIPINYHVVGNR